jgi:DNA-binding transcriptional ArsR family regulator
MSQLRFAASDVARIRFGISPLWETVRSLYAVDDPVRHSLHLPWTRRVRGRATSGPLARQLAPLRAFARPRAWLPDFLTPPPPGPVAEFADELAVLAATPVEVVVADVTATAARRPPAWAVRAAQTDPARLLADLVTGVQAWYTSAIRPYWPRIRALLEADIAYRSRQLAEGGVQRLFDTLHPSVHWVGDRLLCDDPWDVDRDLGGRGLPLMPSVFVDRRVLWAVRADSPPIGIYPARGTATLWQRRPPTDRGLAAVLGTTRARLLSLLEAPATTTELARRVGLAAPTVSQHLQALHAAGLVTRARAGREVLYLTSPSGAGLLRQGATLR